MPHVLFICTANICRSPVAMGLLRQRLEQEGMADWIVSSAGTWAQLPRGAARNSIRVMEEEGINIRDHQARLITAEMLEEADLVLCMEPGHAEALRTEFPHTADKIYLLSEMVGQEYGIDDPYGGPLPEYERMAANIGEIIKDGFDRIVALAQENAATDPDR